MNQPPEHATQPHLVQLGCLLCDQSGAEWATVEMIVKPEGYMIPDGAAKIHGVTTALAMKVGVPLQLAVATFTNLRAIAHSLVAHNLPFDETVMAAAIHRTGRKPAHPGPANRACTMRLATDVIKLPPTERMKSYGFDAKFKPPSLKECYKHFFDLDEVPGAHGALADARACARVFFELKRRAEVQ